MDLIDIILEYYEKGTSEIVLNCEQELTQKEMRVVIIEILSWLKLEHKREMWIKEGKKTKIKPLLLNNNDTWCENLRELVAKEVLFKEYFCINDNKLDFSPNINEENRVIARKKVFENYNPQKRS